MVAKISVSTVGPVAVLGRGRGASAPSLFVQPLPPVGLIYFLPGCHKKQPERTGFSFLRFSFACVIGYIGFYVLTFSYSYSWFC